ncbi:unnamed protein product [Didymodactylos carnosus]|uniref:Uncharacterized protein n=1 Tax=Didymodactylos carnosus TaxID=1234261 RepID=A0A815XAH4_9BILA|nr:unnamed protein product [Didymodactylos carnosus]CAF1555052.1 unnamed protein product [Didymodactylos carnosus]CAF4145633.1 unnamed protein product [Didymodactylos carnosus]CAF4416209.1 unnamed protein product [Didymodactylos carnosus]
MQQFVTSIEKEMGEITTLNTFAEFLGLMGEDVKAEEYYKKMLCTSNKNTNSDQTVKAYKGLGRIAFNNGDYQKSIEIFQKILVLNNQSLTILSDVNFRIGQSYKYLEDYNRCLTYYTKALADRTSSLLPMRYIEISRI